MAIERTRDAISLDRSGPVFIIGSPRSGTSVLAWSLNQHSRLWTSGESDILYELYGPKHVISVYAQAYARPHGWFRAQGVEEAEFLRYLGLGVNALFASRSGTRRWIDQTPLYTLMVDILADMFPDALFLHMLRDGREVVNSMVHFHTLFEKDGKLDWPEGNFVPLWITDFRNACETWTQHVTRAMEFAARRPDRCLTVRYTRLISQPEVVFAEIQSFLGVARENGPMEYFCANRINSSFGGSDGSSQSHAPRALPWDSWSKEQKQIFVHKSGQTLIECGLVTDHELRGMEIEAGVGRHDDIRTQAEFAQNLRASLEGVLPQAARVLVVSKGDDSLVQFSVYEGWHFPCAVDGTYAGYYPANDDEAIGHLERLRGQGAQYLLFPASAFWWLEHYSAFRAYLEQRFPLVVSSGTCIVFALEPPVPPAAEYIDTTQGAPVF